MTSRFFRIGWLVILGGVISLGVVFVYKRVPNHRQTLEAFAQAIGVHQTQQLVAPYHVCYDIGGRCYLMAHYTTKKDHEAIAAVIDGMGYPVVRSSNISGMTIVSEINLSTHHRLTFASSNGVGQRGWNPEVIQWVLSRNPETVVRWYGLSDQNQIVSFDGNPVMENILTVAIRTR